MSQAPIVPIIGGGPAGMSCALWLHNYALHPIIIERDTVLGGMARRSPYPNEWLLGRPGESARENAEAFARHIRANCVETWRGARPRELRRERDGRFRLELAFCGASSASFSAPQSLSAAAIVIATGTRFDGEEWLDRVGNARRLAERGRVHVGAPWAGEPGADLGSHVAVIGGGDNAFDVARMLAEKGVRVTVVMRSLAPKAQPRMVRRLREHQSSGMARILAQRSVRALEDLDSKVRLRLDGGEHIEADHVVLLFGYRPNTGESWMAELALEQDRRGYVIVDANMETSCPGAFAAGDVANPSHPCIATAIAAGSMAAREIGKRLALEARA
jgi:thioredoxin reductase (NADPH)